MSYSISIGVAAATASGTYLTADEVAALAALMKELREVTRSRKTFREATAFLSRFGMPPENSSLVDDGRDG